MLPINNACYLRQINNSQNNKPQTVRKLQTLTRDTISFKGKVEEDRFLNAVKEFLADPMDRYHFDSILAFVQDLKPEDIKAKKMIQEMIEGKHGAGRTQGVGKILNESYGVGGGVVLK